MNSASLKLPELPRFLKAEVLLVMVGEKQKQEKNNSFSVLLKCGLGLALDGSLLGHTKSHFCPSASLPSSKRLQTSRVLPALSEVTVRSTRLVIAKILPRMS